MSSLFELTGKYLDVKNLAEQGVDEQTIMDTLESIDDEIEIKADGYAAVIKHLKGNVEMIDSEIKRLQQLKSTHKNTEKRMKENLYDNMKVTGKTKFKTNLNNFYVKKNPPSLQVEDEGRIPEDYFITSKALDKKSLLQYMKDNELDAFEGARIQQGESLVIR